SIHTTQPAIKSSVAQDADQIGQQYARDKRQSAQNYASYQANQQEATQIRETFAEPSQNATPPITDKAPHPEPWLEAQNSKSWLETQEQDLQDYDQTRQQEATQRTSHTTPNESDEQTQDYSQSKPVASSRPAPLPEPWLGSQINPTRKGRGR
ncbi:hypothetical protein, partial [Helicobacter bizzozeronii]|uniref:hypothetical protein n=1 Tax=Helicobacter bizzozeronii TaxID=56877 RepID=UPI002552CBB9